MLLSITCGTGSSQNDKWIVMKKLALILTLMVSGTAWAQGDVEAGKLKAATCNACHGAAGIATLEQYPNLAGQHEKYLIKQLHDFQQGVTSGGEQGRPNAVMAGMVSGLSEIDIADLSAYFAQLPPMQGTTPEATIEIGQNLYRFGDEDRGITACIACHGPRGNGTPSSGFPKISGQNAEYISDQLMQFQSGDRSNDMNAMMRAVAMKLSKREIEDLSAYVGGLH